MARGGKNRDIRRDQGAGGAHGLVPRPVASSGVTLRSAPPPHWYIFRVRVRGFKSFGSSAWVDVPLGRSAFLLGVVGANGTGKSNLLDALCFAAGCPASSLRARTLQEVASADAGPEAPCAVEFEIRQHQGHQQHLTSDAISHLIHATITYDGSRAFQLDGRLRTAQQLKDFLLDHGIVLDQATSVIRQAAVTHLADSNSPQQLAEVIADASGLSRWVMETRRVTEELGKTHAALTEIGANVARLQMAAGLDEQRSREASRLADLRGEAQRLAANIHGALHCAARQANGDVAAREVALGHAQASATNDKAALMRLAARVEALSTDRAHSPGGAGHGNDASAAKDANGGTSSSYQGLQRQLAVMEQKIAAWNEQLEVARALHQELDEKQKRLAASQQAATRAAEVAAASEHRVEELETIMNGHGSGQQDTGTGLPISQLTALAKTAQQQLHGRVHEATAARQLSSKAAKAAEEAEEKHARLQEEHTQLSTRGLSAATALPHLRHQAQQAAYAVAAQHGLVSQLEMRASSLKAAMGDLCLHGGDGGRLVVGNSSSTHSGKLLHECFSFKQGEGCNGSDGSNAMDAFIKPLSVIAGSKLGVVICDTSEEAVALLASGACTTGSAAGAKLRLWPLDRMQNGDRLHRQRAAVARLGSGRAWVPLDLLQYDPQHEPAIARGLGAHVIAVDTVAASELLSQSDVSSVTLEGSLSQRGSVSGGWDGGGPAMSSEKLLMGKIKCDRVLQQLFEAQQRLTQLEAAEAAAGAAVEEAELLEAAASDHNTMLAAVQCLAGTLAKRAESTAAAMAHAAAAERTAEEAVQRLEMLLSTQNEAKGTSTEEQAVQVQRELEAARAAAASAQRCVEQANAEVERSEAEVDAAGIRLGAATALPGASNSSSHDAEKIGSSSDNDDEERGGWHGLIAADGSGEESSAASNRMAVAERQLQSSRAQLGKLQLQLQQARIQEENQARLRAKQAAELEALMQQRQLAHAKLAKAQGTVARAAAELDLARQRQTMTAEALQQHQQDCADNLAVPGRQAGLHTDVTPGDETVPDVASIPRLQAALRSCQEERARLEAKKGPLAGQLLAAERAQSILLFQQQADLLRAAAASLEEGVTVSRKQAMDANEYAFEAVRRKFEVLCSSLLSGLSVSLSRTKPEGSAADGVIIQFSRAMAVDVAVTAGKRYPKCRVADCEDEAVRSGSWSSNLEQLSGGQRTLVSLALLLAAARAGCRSSVFLLDEVDAALDEHNQQRAAALLHQLAHDDGCQVICVSHNATFQEACDAVVRLAWRAGGRNTVTVLEGLETSGTDGSHFASGDVGKAGVGAGSELGHLTTETQKRKTCTGGVRRGGRKLV